MSPYRKALEDMLREWDRLDQDNPHAMHLNNSHKTTLLGEAMARAATTPVPTGAVKWPCNG